MGVNLILKKAVVEAEDPEVEDQIIREHREYIIVQL